jgi:hypothetical protein
MTAIVGVLLACLLLPMVAQLAGQAIPVLLALLALVAIATLIWPSRRR